MSDWIALFRGINVGGSNILPMAELRGVLAGLGLEAVRTYIQSGNAVFRSAQTSRDKLEGRITSAIETSHGFAPGVMLLSVKEFRDAIDANPFPDGEEQPKSLHLFFLAAEPVDPDLQGLDAVKSGREDYRLEGKLFYLHAPDGIGRSKLGARVEKSLGVPATARNWRTVTRILQLAGGT